ncbi:MAG TPA: AAA family ATPase [Candidatus Paceibacterota bacterium]|nr:AAA family ATPase [Candidatus Paceibacterota bacterium]
MTQAKALAIMKTGVNIYLTGSAGSGKTHTLNQYINYLKDHGIEVAVTASTGIAATHMNGMTIHGFSGIGIRDNLTEYDLDELTQKPYLVKRFHKTKVLIIDEVSMLHARTLDAVDLVCRKFKRNNLPFGGMQVILSGDFFQLPPITRSHSTGPQIDMFDQTEGSEQIPKDLIVYSRAWKEMRPAICYLTEQHRQDDQIFTNILNKIRENKIEAEHLEIIKGRINAVLDGEIPPTKLYTHNVDVDTINQRELQKLSEMEYNYEMQTKGRDVIVEILKKSCLAHEKLSLKKGAQVMFIKNNFELGYVNGTRGIVESFRIDRTPVVRLMNGKRIEVKEESWMIEEDGKSKASLMQLPLRLAWAITIHKSQGMSLDSAEIDLSKTFTYGMGYVALSRVRTLNGIRLVGLSENSLKVDPNVLELDEKLQVESEENEEMFGKLSTTEQEKMERDFILRSEGFIKAGVAKKLKEKSSTIEITKSLLLKKMTFAEIAKERGLGLSTILDHVEKLIARGDELPLGHTYPDKNNIKLVQSCIDSIQGDDKWKLAPIKTMLDKKKKHLTFDQIRIARIFCKK